MNIVQLEDDIKSLPDENLITEMQNPTGGFPQYLVMSEIKRRKQMRDDYQGRMAAYEKTPPRPTMAEETVQQGIGTIMPSNMPQGTPPQGMPMAPQGMPMAPQGMPMAPQGMPVNRPASIEGGGLESLMPQGIPQGMAGGGLTNRVMLGKTNYQGATPQYGSSSSSLSSYGYGSDPSDPFGFLSQYGIDPSTMFGLTDAEKLAQERYLDYYSPEKRKERGRFSKGLNLLQAGLAVGTARTPEQLSASMGPVIQGAAAGKLEQEKKELAAVGAAASVSKLEKDRQMKMAELALKADYYKAMREQALKPEPIVSLAKSLAKNMPEKYGGKRLPDIDDQGNIILDSQTNKPTYTQKRGIAEYNAAAYESASKSLKTMGAYQRAGVSEQQYIQEEMAKTEFRIGLMKGAAREGLEEGTKAYDDYIKEKENEKREELKIAYDEYIKPMMAL